MKNNIKIFILILSFGFIACNTKTKNKEEAPKPNEIAEGLTTEIKSPNTFDDLWKIVPLKRTPIVDTTNFDNIKGAKVFSREDLEVLQLNKIYTDLSNEGSNYKFMPSYKLALSDEFYTMVVHVYKGDYELETVLLNYSLEEKLTAHAIIAYDEIAEGWARKHAKIEDRIITVISTLYGEDIKMDTTLFHLNPTGGIDPIKTTFSSDLRPNEAIALNKTYTDTVEFSTYNDDYDYGIIIGKKKGKEIGLIYNWDWNNNEKYHFKPGDLLKITWKMDRIIHAGDEELLDFTERAIDAERITPQNESVQFLWRAEQFDEEINQHVNSIFINESFINSISNPEKAALAFVATFVGNECAWDGDANEDRSNLKCKILTALDLGYQCSDQHLGFLQKWFFQDTVALKKLERCGTMPYTATVQTTFDEISIFTDEANKTILVNSQIEGINIRASKTWSFTQSDKFTYNTETIELINSEKSEVIEKDITIDEN